MMEDFRYGFRTLMKSSGFALMALLVLSVGIGVNATVFSLANAVLFKNLPFADSDRVLYLSEINLKRAIQRGGFSYPDFRDYRTQTKAFDGMGAADQDIVNVSEGNRLPERHSAPSVTANTFSVIGQKPVLGRDFLPSDEAPGAKPVAILSYGMWQDRYGKDPSVIGRTIRVNEVPTTIIGVMPDGIRFPEDADLWIPLIPTNSWEFRANRGLLVFGRLSKSASIRSAQSEAAIIAQRLAASYPDSNADIGVRVQDFNEYHMGQEGELRLIFLAMLGAVGFVLLIACANVANLMLARAAGRVREISIRAALGAGRWRVIRQLLVESVMLAALAGVLGCLMATWGVKAFDAAVAGTGKPSYIDFSLDYRVLAYVAAISLGTGILFGLAPALRLAKVDVNHALKDGGRGAGGSVRGKYLSGLLVVTEMALAIVLLAGAGLMIRSFLNTYHADLGFDPRNMLTMRLDLPDTKYREADKKSAFLDQLTARLGALPGVEIASVVSTVPQTGAMRFMCDFEDAPAANPRFRPMEGGVVVSPSYFATLGLKPVAGRVFENTDNGAIPVAIVSQSFARKHWNGQSAIGKRFRVSNLNDTPQPWMTVVGVVPDVSQSGFSGHPSEPIFYLPYRQRPQRVISILARTRVPPATLADAFRREVQTLDQDLPVFGLTTLENQVYLRNWPYRVFGSLFTIFAAIALLLASVGLYAVTANSVNQRTQEIGVRVALGARPGDVVRMVLMQGARQLAIGLPVGLAAAFAITRVLRGILIDVSPGDPATFIGAAAVLVCAALLGNMIPAMRAMRVDPVVALRHE